MKSIFLFILFVIITLGSKAQSSYYSLIQGGANIGLINKGYNGTFSGYSAHFIFGKNFNDRAYLGLGIGNDRLKGRYEKTTIHSFDATIESSEYDRQLFPIFIDGRLPFKNFGTNSKIGLLANAGYAPSIATNYDKGLLIKGGIFYLHERHGKIDWTVSTAYGYQELSGNRIDVGRKFQQQQLNIAIGIILK